MHRCLETLELGLGTKESVKPELGATRHKPAITGPNATIMEEKENLQGQLNTYRYQLIECHEQNLQLKAENEKLTKLDDIISVGMNRQKTD